MVTNAHTIELVNVPSAELGCAEEALMNITAYALDTLDRAPRLDDDFIDLFVFLDYFFLVFCLTAMITPFSFGWSQFRRHDES